MGLDIATGLRESSNEEGIKRRNGGESNYLDLGSLSSFSLKDRLKIRQKGSMFGFVKQDLLNDVFAYISCNELLDKIAKINVRFNR